MGGTVRPASKTIQFVKWHAGAMRVKKAPFPVIANVTNISKPDKTVETVGTPVNLTLSFDLVNFGEYFDSYGGALWPESLAWKSLLPMK